MASHVEEGVQLAPAGERGQGSRSGCHGTGERSSPDHVPFCLTLPLARARPDNQQEQKAAERVHRRRIRPRGCRFPESDRRKIEV
jgi:hypothetical protein